MEGGVFLGGGMGKGNKMCLLNQSWHVITSMVRY